MAVLSMLKADGGIETHSLPSTPFSLGRGMGNDLVIQNPVVSREHAVLHLTPSGYAIQDLGSKNGTWVNGTRLGTSPQKLVHGDTILLGNVQVCLCFYVTDETITAAQGQEALPGVSVDLAGREVWVQGQRVSPPLTNKEFDILTLLWQRRGQACSRDVLAAHGWPERETGDVGDAEIDQYIRRLRRRLGDTGKNNPIILTIRGYGYKIP